jgi:hypothetical protein
MAKVKQATAKKVAEESVYQRACAEWVANYLKHTSAAAIYGVDFYLDEGYTSSCCGYECDGYCGSMDTSPSWGLEFYIAGNRGQLSLTYELKAGQFVEECVALLDKHRQIVYTTE